MFLKISYAKKEKKVERGRWRKRGSEAAYRLMNFLAGYPGNNPGKHLII